MIELINVTKKFENKNTIVFPNKIIINSGEMVAVIGKSGIGKTTLLNIIGLLDRKESGSYFLNKQDTKLLTEKEVSTLRNKSIGFVFQDFKLIDDLTPKQNILLPRRIGKMKSDGDFEKLIEIFQLRSLLDNSISELSGGQKQRVAFARAMIMSPSIILADEPTGSLDSNNALIMLDYLKQLNKMGTTIITVTHDKDIALQHNKIIQLGD
ncbi:ABC transporter ATP-binding protein [Leuconostoc sp. MS02]|uniref:ABC transporter ATP-binding protein n=1 Tax=Leuconostoc aquikimchii TaxID=3236804 RepID=A0ABV3S587_9LACO